MGLYLSQSKSYGVYVHIFLRGILVKYPSVHFTIPFFVLQLKQLEHKIISWFSSSVRLMGEWGLGKPPIVKYALFIITIPSDSNSRHQLTRIGFDKHTDFIGELIDEIFQFPYFCIRSKQM